MGIKSLPYDRNTWLAKDFAMRTFPLLAVITMPKTRQFFESALRESAMLSVFI
jgi:hypothetical protein